MALAPSVAVTVASPIAVRPATPSDWPDVIRLVLALAEYEHLTPPDTAAQQRLFNDTFGNRPRIQVFLGFADSQAVAYMILLETYSSFTALPTLFIEDLFVLEAFRKRGVGHALFSLAIAEAKQRGCGRVEWSVLTWNQLAINFYERHGARRLTEWHFYRLDSVEFDRLLAAK